jgi:hypothetical protein
MIRFGYQREALRGRSPPTLRAGATFRLRPQVAIRVWGPGGRFRRFGNAVVDTGADASVFPWDTATIIAASLFAEAGFQLSWKGSNYPLRYGRVELEIASTQEILRWPAIIGFTSAPLPYPLLGMTGFLEYFDASFLGEDNALELKPNGAFPGTAKVHA